MDYPAVVIDNGSSTIRAGLAGDEVPRHPFLSIVGKWIGRPMPGTSAKDAFVGDEGFGVCRSWLRFSYPIKRGAITNWDDAEKLWHHAFYNQVRVAPEEQPVLLSEPIAMSRSEKERITQIMFETFNVPACYLAVSSMLALLNTGRTTGLVLDSGGGSTRAVPIVDGVVQRQSVTKVDLGGIDLSNFSKTLVQEKNLDFFNQMTGPDVAEKIKCQHGYVAIDYEAECKSVGGISYELPDGKSISIGSERFTVGEALFRPSLMGVDSCGVHEIVPQAICDFSSEHLKNSFWKSVVLTGGCTMFPGFSQRLQNELLNLNPNVPKIKIIENRSKDYGAFIGGSILASLGTFQNVWIDRQTYHEWGPQGLSFLELRA